MSGARAEWFVRLTMRVLALSFATVGILFIATPDGVVEVLEDFGQEIGDFSPAPDTQVHMWLGLGFAYMTVITGIALVVSADPARFRPLLLVLAAGKAASSLSTGAFFLDDDHFILLANFVVDGSLVGLSLLCWVLAGRIGDTGAGPAVAAPAVSAREDDAPRAEAAAPD